VTSSDIERLFVIFGRGVNTPPATFISVPTDAGQLRPGSDYLISGAAGSGESKVTSSQRIFVASHGQGTPTIAVAVVRPGSQATETLVADIPVSHLADWLRPIVGAGQRIYVLDESDRQIAAVGGNDTGAAPPLTSLVLDAVRGRDHVAPW